MLMRERGDQRKKRQRGREAERQRGREAERQRGREAERQRGREAERWKKRTTLGLEYFRDKLAPRRRQAAEQSQ
jgi:hypothetical protein